MAIILFHFRRPAVAPGRAGERHAIDVLLLQSIVYQVKQ
jgi:hypothetical protein